MPRFRFPIIDGDCLDDHVGIDFPHLTAAKEHAERIALIMPKTRERHVSVLDERNTEVFRVHVSKED
jgi:hypothetical protein